MKAAAFLALALFAAVSSASLIHDDVDLINEVNSLNAGWTAGKNERFAGWTYDDARTLLGALPSAVPAGFVTKEYPVTRLSDVPASFDARNVWGKCIHPIRDQERCGSCWAFSASEVLSDRMCIESNGTADVILSPQDLVSCDTTDMGCNGGMLPNVWSWMRKHGVASDACMPYTSGGGITGSCPKTCADGSAPQRHHAASSYHVTSLFHRPATIQQEIMAKGPVQAAFTVYADFMSYKSGVYKHTSGQQLGGHAIKIVGWGSEGGQDYWLVANSWNTTWGEEGFFKIRRGHNECGIEANVYGGTAQL